MSSRSSYNQGGGGGQDIRKQLKKVQNEQNLELMMNPGFYLSAEEQARIEKTKEKMRKYFKKFFERHAFKKHAAYFKKWRAYCEYKKNRSAEYAAVKKFLKNREAYYQALRDEKQRQMSRDLLNGFKSLNMNKLKADEDEGSHSEGSELDESAEAKKQETGAF